MFEENLQRLAESVTPGDDVKTRLKARVLRTIEPVNLRPVASSVVPDQNTRLSLKQKILNAIKISPIADHLSSVGAKADLLPVRFQSLREAVMSRLAPITQTPLIHSWLKWSASFAVLVLAIRAMPLVLLTPVTRADLGVQIIPNGSDVSVLKEGEWHSVLKPELIRSAASIRTGDSQATLILNDDGVIRLAPNTSFTLHDLCDRPQCSGSVPTATLERGQVWLFGILPPLVDGISIETLHGIATINSGSASISDDGKAMTIAVYDRGATFHHGNQTSFLVSGEQGVIRSSGQLSIATLPVSAFTQSFAATNLAQDAVHRGEIAKLQQERRTRMAGILPTSIFYPAKRIAEHVDVFFTLSEDGKTEKRVAQADTRLSEALALLKDGQSNQATVPLTEYRDSLIAMASGTGDNLVKYLIRQQIADASATLTPATSSGTTADLIRSAVIDISAVIPDTALKSKDIEGYVLVDKLTEINHMLTVEQDLSGALTAYTDVQPYLTALLGTKDGTHPLLQKEAKSLLASTSSLIKKAQENADSAELKAVVADIGLYLPAEQEDVLVSEQELNEIVQGIYDRIFIFKAPLSRYNQLQLEMQKLRGNPNRGTLLRRLYRALPQVGLGDYVLTEIKNFGDELKR